MSFRPPRARYTFQAQPNVFVFTNSSIANDSLPALPPNFGLEPSKKWSQAVHEVKTLNAKSANTKEHFKIIFAARHGQGYHNVAEDKYGTKEWDAHWSLLRGDGELTWGPDPHLTRLGEDQAREACLKWKELLSKDIPDPPPIPSLFISSPLIRSAKTLELSYEGIVDGKNGKMKPMILECVREDFKDRHTCDQRSTKSVIAKEWEGKGWIVDEKMDEEDTLFESEYKETKETMTERFRDALSYIFDISQGHDVINITSHSGAMQSLFRAVHHDDFKPKTGGVVTLLVKATEIQRAP